MLEKLKKIVDNVKHELKVWQLVMKDKRTPLLAKILLGLAIAYLFLPFDIIPDFIPGLGHLDDLIIVGFLIIIALNLIPKEVVEDCRIRVQHGLE